MKNLFPLLIIAIIALASGLYFFRPKEIYLNHECSLQKEGSCSISQEGVKITLRLDPLPIIPTDDLKYILETEGIKMKKATVRLLGHDMEMPRDEQVFELKSLLNPNRVEATRTFPTCTEKIMTWRIYLVLEGEEKWVRTTFDLEVERPKGMIRS